jgi:hypothetical protein
MPHVIAVVTNTEDYDEEPEYVAQVSEEGYVHPDQQVADSVYCINYKEAWAVVHAFNGGEYHSLDAALNAVRMEYRSPRR